MTPSAPSAPRPGHRTRRQGLVQGQDQHDGAGEHPGSDFASAAMLRLIRLGLARQGLALPQAAAAAPPQAHVPLADKRALASALLAQHGPQVLFRIGEAVLDAPDEPTLSALLAARDPLDLVKRFQRLERYLHSRHRVLLHQAAPGALLLQHRSMQADSPPHAAENLLVWGLLVGVLQRLGTPGLVARWQAGHTADLHLAWQVQPAAPAPPPAPVADTTAQARRLLADDLGAGWRLPQLAAALGLTPRTLQRRLAQQGSSFARLWAEVRLGAAGRLLTAGQHGVAEVGLCCGFADQAHFTRCFLQHTALTPARFRREFAQRHAQQVDTGRPG